MKDRIRWEVQWHPANGARIRRLVVTSRSFRRLMLALGVASWVVIAGALWAGLDGFLTRFAIDSARRQNTALRAQQEALREQAFDLAGRLFDGVEYGRRAGPVADTPSRAWQDQSLRLPPRDAGNEIILAWLSEQNVRLATPGNRPAAGQIEIFGKPASPRAPVNRVFATVRGASALNVADMEPSSRQKAAPARR